MVYFSGTHSERETFGRWLFLASYPVMLALGLLPLGGLFACVAAGLEL